MAKSTARETEQAAGYATEVPYTFHYFNELAPVNLHHAAKINGYTTVDITKPFKYLELGCGNAMSLCLNAYANPHAEFYGVDLMPQHIEFANKFIEKAGLTNLTLLHSSFAELKLKKLPDFDIIVTHGVISWVSDEVHAQMREIVDKKLKPGGYYYVSYNAMPGWADKAPLQELLGHFISKTVDPQERLKQGIQLIKFLQENKAGYFVANPNLDREIKHMLKQAPNYLIHEYMNEHWRAFYFREIAKYCQDINCQYIGNANFRDNHFELMIPKSFHRLIGELHANNHREFREAMQDFIINNRFRKDVYLKQDKDKSFKTTAEPHAGSNYVNLNIAETRRKEVEINGIKYNLSHEHFDFLHEQLAHHSKTYEELKAAADEKGMNDAVLRKHLEIYTSLSQAIPTLNPINWPDHEVNLAVCKFSHPIYELLIGNFAGKERVVQLPSKRLGSAINLDSQSALFILHLLRNQCDIDKAFQALHDSVEKDKQESLEQNREQIIKVMTHCRDKVIPLLVALGVVEEVYEDQVND